MKRKSIVVVMLLALVLLMTNSVVLSKNVVEISIQDVWADNLSWGRAWLQTLKTFEESHPHIKINRIYCPIGQNVERILLGTRTKNLPDIITCDTPDVPHLAEAGSLLDLTSFFGQWGKWDDLFPGSQDAVTWKGKPYAVQFTTNTLALHYNKDLFAKAGLTRPPETWDELLEWAKRLTTSDTYGFAFSAIDTEEATWHFAPFLWSNGGDLLDLSKPESVQALEFLTTFVKEGYTSRDVVNWNQGDVGVQFRLGRVAMMIHGCWDIPLSEEAGINLGIAKIPVPKKGMNPVVPIGGETFAISPFSSPEKQKAAWEFLTWMLEEGMVEFNQLVNNIPTRRSIAPSVIQTKPLLQPYIEELEHGVNRFTVGGGENYTKVSIITRAAIQKALIGQTTPEKAFKEAAGEIKKLMK
ncbi:MAG: ABC transporter substrate-binding protein [Firmicutes bacterium]|nr:ABC transporter substrate-binding protein [Bacillota bacterium]